MKAASNVALLFSPYLWVISAVGCKGLPGQTSAGCGDMLCLNASTAYQAAL